MSRSVLLSASEMDSQRVCSSPAPSECEFEMDEHHTWSGNGMRWGAIRARERGECGDLCLRS